MEQLIASDRIQYIVTQNCDSLERKAGIDPSKLSELHGNVFVEYCERCMREYVRDYCVDEFSTDCYLEKCEQKEELF